ncbi:Ig-like domain-containing protein [Galbibacter sp. BG1]
MKYQNIHIKQFLFGLFLLLTFQMQAQFILEAPKTSVENGVISNYKWYVQDGMEENGGDAVWLPSSQDGDHLLEVKIPGVYYATYDGTKCGKNATSYFVVTYCNSPANEVTLNVAGSVGTSAAVTWNEGLSGLSPTVKAGTTYIEYIATLQKGGSAKQLPTFTVVCLRNEFQLVDDVVASVATTGTTINMLENDSDIPTIGVIEVTKAQYGTVVLNQNETSENPSDDTITYIPGSNFKGQDEFTYSLSVLNTDGSPMADTATITINALYAEDDSLDVLQDSSPGVSNQIDVRENDNIGAAGSSGNDYQYNTDASNGTVVEVSDGVFEYIPNPSFNGNDRFSYTLTDANGNQTTAVVRVTIVEVTDNSANDAPVAEDDFYVFDGESLIMDVLVNDTDPDGDALSIYDYVLPAHGLVEFNSNDNTTLIYTSEPGFVGEDSFTYTVSDGNGGFDTATVHVDVSDGNDDRDDIAENDNVTTDEDTVITIKVLDNDNVDWVSNFSIEVDTPIYGTAIKNADNTITYTPESDFVGNDTFEYSINYTNIDGVMESSSATVLIKVNAVVDVVDDLYYVDSSNPSEVIFNVLENDAFNENSNLVISSIGTPGNGVATINSDNTISYVVDANYEGQDVFSYVVDVIHSDGSINFERGFITVNAEPLNPAPPPPPAPEEDLQIHQLVSPNGDGRNDFFKIGGIELYPQNSVKIFNRWGVLVFETEGYGQSTNHFNGYSQGRITIGQNNKLPVGTYYYAIEYVKDQTTKSTAGYLYINY